MSFCFLCILHSKERTVDLNQKSTLRVSKCNHSCFKTSSVLLQVRLFIKLALFKGTVETETPQDIMQNECECEILPQSCIQPVSGDVTAASADAGSCPLPVEFLLDNYSTRLHHWSLDNADLKTGRHRVFKTENLPKMWLIKILNFAFCSVLLWTVSVQHHSLIPVVWAHTFTFSHLPKGYVMRRLEVCIMKNIICFAGCSNWWTIVMEISCWKTGNSILVVWRHGTCLTPEAELWLRPSSTVNATAARIANLQKTQNRAACIVCGCNYMSSVLLYSLLLFIRNVSVTRTLPVFISYQELYYSFDYHK